MALADIRHDIDARGDDHAEVKRLRCRLAAKTLDAKTFQDQRDTARGRIKELEGLLERMGARRNRSGAWLIDAPARKAVELTQMRDLRERVERLERHNTALRLLAKKYAPSSEREKVGA